MLLFVVACLLPSFVLSFAATALMRRVAPSLGLVDRPAARKVHEHPTPLGGGVGIWCGVVVPLALVHVACFVLAGREAPPAWLPADIAVHIDGVPYRSGQMWAVIAGGTVLSLMGLFDDRRPLPWLPRLVVQVGVAAALVAAGVRGTVFVPLPWIGVVVTLGWMLVLINSFNFLDNMDGLSGGIAFVAAGLFAVVMLHSTGEPRWFVGGVLLMLTGAVGGFLCHNLPPARIFMGDCGSYFIGVMLASMTVLGTFYDESTGSRHVMLAPLCILAVPLYDFASVIVIRLVQRRSPFQPDKSHFSHRLVELGLTRATAVRTIHLVTLTTGLGALVLYEVPGWSAAWLVVAMVACQLGVIAVLEWHRPAAPSGQDAGQAENSAAQATNTAT